MNASKALYQRQRDSDTLLVRLDKSRKMIGKMCSERRPPKMSIPVQWDDEDEYITGAINDAMAFIEEMYRGEL